MMIRASCVALLLFSLSVSVQAQKTVVYASNSNSNNISAWTLDTTTGALTPIAGQPFAAGSEPNSVGIDPFHRFLYVTNESTSTTLPSNVSAYTIDQITGALTPVAGSPFAAGIAPNYARVHPSGLFLYCANEGDQTISGYSINTTTGALTPIAGSPFATGVAPGNNTDSIGFDPTGKFAYVSVNSSPGAVLAFTVNTTTGALTPVAGSPFTTGTNSDTVVVDPAGKFLYVGNFGSMDVSAFTINSSTGALTPVAGSPFAIGGGRPDQVNVDPTGKFVFTANDSGTSGIGVQSINPATGALTSIAGSPFPAGNSPSGVTVDPSGQFVFSANENSGDVSVFSLNSTTGVLTNVSGSPFTAGTEPGMIASAVIGASIPALSHLMLLALGLALATAALTLLRQ